MVYSAWIRNARSALQPIAALLLLAGCNALLGNEKRTAHSEVEQWLDGGMNLDGSQRSNGQTGRAGGQAGSTAAVSGAKAGNPSNPEAPMGGRGGGSVPETGASSSGKAPSCECSSSAPVCTDGRCVECVGGSICRGLTPWTCVDEHWTEQPPCSGSTPVCVNGVCSAIGLIGGFITQAEASARNQLRLSEHGFEGPTISCNQTLCVSGAFEQ